MRLFLRYLFATVWLVNGTVKLLHLVPRHEAIVARIVGATHATVLTRLIGVAELGMTIWVLSGRWVRVNAALQIAVVLLMNVLEFWLAPDLLLWHRLNIVFAGLFALVVYYYGFVLQPAATVPTAQ
ncbi:DoxX-like family protein [Hymenobacter aerilatus]|uniref:DoxX-like family protein n=1 Tax=Hymenobacter aerilatus TaxID=2932251 RepID=A0A8T9SVJ2_9BACT|nr:DoxX-like family protein [Hymenobacter aerilatus]UOR06192.1 DoxX-like family protein [Hymenobacter aerilatus]